VQAGIPDFQSPGLGIYSSIPLLVQSSQADEEGTDALKMRNVVEELKAKYRFDSLEQVFDALIFETDPAPFWAVVQHLFLPV